MRYGYLNTLEENLQVFLEHWGPIAWRGRIDNVQPSPNEEISQLLAALSGIEDDAFYMQTKLRHSGAAELAPVKQFNAVWLVEEADHGRALSVLAAKYGAAKVRAASDHATFRRDRRSILAVPIMKAISPYRRGTLAAYLTAGVFVEYAAVTTYKAIAKALEDPIAKDVLIQMSRQEGRHMRFYRKGAIAVLDGSPTTQRFVRLIMERYWRPPGVDLYGTRRWVELFSPLLSDEENWHRYIQMDNLCEEIPGLHGLKLMEHFLGYCSSISATNLPLTAHAREVAHGTVS